MITYERVRNAFLLLFVLAIFGIVGGMDRDDEIRFRSDYCAQVAKQHAPGYRRVEAESCRGIGERP